MEILLSVLAEIMKSQPVGTLVGLVAIVLVVAMRIPWEQIVRRKRDV